MTANILFKILVSLRSYVFDKNEEVLKTSQRQIGNWEKSLNIMENIKSFLKFVIKTKENFCSISVLTWTNNIHVPLPYISPQNRRWGWPPSWHHASETLSHQNLSPKLFGDKLSPFRHHFQLVVKLSINDILVIKTLLSLKLLCHRNVTRWHTAVFPLV